MLSFLIALLCTAIGTLYLYLVHKKNYWKNKNIEAPPASLVFGNYADLFLMKKNFAETVADICKQYPKKPVIPVVFGTSPAVIVKDPEVLKLVTTKDYYYFSSRELSGYTDRETFTKNVFASEGDYWRVLRQNLTPIFSSAKMKKMFHLIEKCTVQLEKLLEQEVRAKDDHEVRYLMSRYTMDCIGSCAFGVDTNVMSDKDETNNPFRKIASAIFVVSPVRQGLNLFRLSWPGLFYNLKLNVFPAMIQKFFSKLLVDVFQSRDYKPSERHDFVDLISNHMLGIPLEKKTRVHIPVYYMHHNEEYFPEPEEFKPERFLEENKHKIIPYTYMPFGEGPRLCIGMRFARMQILAGLVTIFRKYRVGLAENMPRVLELEPMGPITASKTGIHLKFFPREEVKAA